MNPTAHPRSGRRIRGVAAGSLKVVAAGADLLRRPPAGMTVLIYHRVGQRSGLSVDLPSTLFREQMRFLADSGSVRTLDDGVAALSGGAPMDRRCVVVTFDDGTADWVDEVLPVLVEFAIPATFFVASGFVDEGRSFPANGSPISWAGLREMSSTGLATIGSHTHSHALLDRIDSTTAREECERSVARIESEVGVACRHFAYPKALLGSDENQAEVRRIFASASIARGRVNLAGADAYRLTRTPIQVQDGMTWFRRKVFGGLQLEGELRERRSSRRYAHANE